jgi:Protein of unknown function (DUF1214)
MAWNGWWRFPTKWTMNFSASIRFLRDAFLWPSMRLKYSMRSTTQFWWSSLTPLCGSSERNTARKDANGEPLSGGSNYRLNLPPNIPAANFWSVTLYEAENASGLANGQPFPSLGSRDKPVQNADGSTDLYFGSKAPQGKEANWLATVPGRGYFAILRLYGPTEAAIDKSWKPGDIERVK